MVSSSHNPNVHSFIIACMVDLQGLMGIRTAGDTLGQALVIFEVRLCDCAIGERDLH